MARSLLALDREQVFEPLGPSFVLQGENRFVGTLDELLPRGIRMMDRNCDM